jgi:hypothetical protein
MQVGLSQAILLDQCGQFFLNPVFVDPLYIKLIVPQAIVDIEQKVSICLGRAQQTPL